MTQAATPGSAVMTKTALIAVEDSNILYLLQRYAEESGFETVTARTSTVLDRATHLQPVFIILDGALPEAAGRKLLSRLHARAETRTIPVILYVSLDEPAAPWTTGAAGCLPKSVKYADFLTMLAHIGVMRGDHATGDAMACASDV
ncbi:MAG: Polar-differentiation response regulator DivK [Chloroflexi bacterium ADurb.Bin325]|nr:MAG: Polar-differentiation response regulator DivK [Chloroflexi bacterium ADurb.Bin325]